MVSLVDEVVVTAYDIIPPSRVAAMKLQLYKSVICQWLPPPIRYF